jgi:uncharacterized protein
MKVAIVGTGISGLVAARCLYSHVDLTLFEANDYIGGHTNTIDVQEDHQRLAIDTGFIVFNRETYPNFCKLLDQLGVASQPTEMSFSVRCDRTGLEYRGVDLNGLFAQRRNLVNPKFLRMLLDFFRFNKSARRLLETQDESVTVDEFLRREKFSRAFIEHYFVPMGAAVWSCPPEKFKQFPIRFIASFYKNHGMLSAYERPQWRVIRGGSQQYVAPLTAGFRERIRLRTAVERIHRSREQVFIETSTGERLGFDHVVLACHSDQALKMLAEPNSLERELLGRFKYEPNEAILHTDTRVLPKLRRAWASWNYHLRKEDSGKATVTYNMNILQSLKSSETYCVTLNAPNGGFGDNATSSIDSAKIIGRFQYHHPVFTLERAKAQSRHAELLGKHRTSFCGAYWGNGFHEDGVHSGLVAAEQLLKMYRLSHDASLAVTNSEHPQPGESHLTFATP